MGGRARPDVYHALKKRKEGLTRVCNPTKPSNQIVLNLSRKEFEAMKMDTVVDQKHLSNVVNCKACIRLTNPVEAKKLSQAGLTAYLAMRNGKKQEKIPVPPETLNDKYPTTKVQTVLMMGLMRELKGFVAGLNMYSQTLKDLTQSLNALTQGLNVLIK